MLGSIPARLDRSAIKPGLAIAALLAALALFFSITADLGLDEALRRASRAALLVLVATWMRAAAGSLGLREVFRRTLMHLRAIPSLREAALTLAGTRLGRAADDRRAVRRRSARQGADAARARGRRGTRLGGARVEPLPRSGTRRGAQSSACASATAPSSRCGALPVLALPGVI